MESKRITVLVPRQLADRLEKYHEKQGKRRGEKVSETVRRALDSYLTEHEGDK